jgi:hypothetical protein
MTKNLELGKLSLIMKQSQCQSATVDSRYMVQRVPLEVEISARTHTSSHVIQGTQHDAHSGGPATATPSHIALHASPAQGDAAGMLLPWASPNLASGKHVGEANLRE